MARFPQAALYLGGDKNSLPLALLLSALTRFSQIVAHPTQREKTIDVLIVSCPEFYSVPVVTPPVLPDNPRQAAPSDHGVPVAWPLASSPEAATNVYTEQRWAITGFYPVDTETETNPENTRPIDTTQD